MIVRREQMQILEHYTLQRFVSRLAARLRIEFPSQTAELVDSELRSLIQTAVRKAETYGITDEFDVQRYLEFVLRYGLEFDTGKGTAWAGGVLNRAFPSGTEKMDALDEYELFEFGLS